MIKIFIGHYINVFYSTVLLYTSYAADDPFPFNLRVSPKLKKKNKHKKTKK
ncbi:hypothetical protein [Escherichia coli]|uniref:hypothetical protein n=1 Tax=Escherichia coli TaxID=562 RepID=UPI00406A5E17